MPSARSVKADLLQDVPEKAYLPAEMANDDDSCQGNILERRAVYIAAVAHNELLLHNWRQLIGWQQNRCNM